VALTHHRRINWRMERERMEAEMQAELAEGQAFMRFEVLGGIYPRIRFGEGGSDQDFESDERCGLCLAAKGQLHALQCEGEPCARCEKDSLNCLCFGIGPIERIPRG
jgi:hypothetical protein